MTRSRKFNFDPKIWGSDAWNFIHIVALSYPDEPNSADKKNYKKFFESMGYVLPCEKCCENYKKHTKKFPISKYMKNSDDLFAWTVLIRNETTKSIKGNKKFINQKQLKEHFLSLQNGTHKPQKGSGKSSVETQTLVNRAIALGTALLVIVFAS